MNTSYCAIHTHTRAEEAELGVGVGLAFYNVTLRSKPEDEVQVE